MRWKLRHWWEQVHPVRWSALLLLALGFILASAPEQPPLDDERSRLSAVVGLRDFDFLSWELQALATKGYSALTNGHRYLTETEQKELVLRFMELAGEVRLLNLRLEQVAALATDEAEAAAETAALQTELAAARDEMSRLQPLAEAILEDQVTAVLRDEGFGLLGSVVPPVKAHMTPLPLMLVISPRNDIERLYSLPLKHGLSVPEQEQLEQAVSEQLDWSALVVPIGGLGVFPAMVVENGNLNWTAATFAHEWVHHWLGAHPLGLNYYRDGVVATINETVASVVGDEVGAEVIRRYYPELVPEPLPPAEAIPPPEDGAAEAPPFDFRAEMRETRIEVDRLLALGEVEAAEAYMEQRRRLFVENGYLIRKLNQAYFAFYGAYADQPGATGADPIGPTVIAVRRASSSLHLFLNEMADVTTREQLGLLLERLEAGDGAGTAPALASD